MCTRFLTLVTMGKDECDSKQRKKDFKQKNLEECERCFICEQLYTVCVCVCVCARVRACLERELIGQIEK